MGLPRPGRVHLLPGAPDGTQVEGGDKLVAILARDRKDTFAGHDRGGVAGTELGREDRICK